MADIPAGWPCATLPATPPSVADKQAYPSADELLPQVLALTPRGPAWGTDEAGDGSGASPIMLRFWRAIAGRVADQNAREFDLATQGLPSAITWSLSDWEREYGLPDLCSSGEGGTVARVAAVRARFGSVGGSSPAYFVCLAQSVGYDITIEEPTQFFVDDSEVVGEEPEEIWFLIDEGECDSDPLEALVLAPAPDDTGDQLAGGVIEAYFTTDEGECDETPLESVAGPDRAGTVWKYWVVHVGSLGETWFHVDEGEVGYDPLEGFLSARDLECLLRRQAPPHTELVFNYA